MNLKRYFDIVSAIFLLLFFAVPMGVMAMAIRITSPGPVIYWSDRIGHDNAVFRMPKFRTMRTDAPAIATHLMENPAAYITPVGAFLRKTSLDELLQLWSILTGDMSMVGPRPALFNQDDLIELRTASGVHQLIPGLTGWAQVNGRDELPIPEKVKLDVEYLHKRSFWFDLKIIAITLLRAIGRHGISH